MIRRFLLAAAFLAVGNIAQADVFIPPPGIERVAQADAVFVGKVIAIEPQDIEVPLGPNSPLKYHLRVAVVSVSEMILGDKKAMTVRVGFVPPGEKNRPWGFGKYPELNFKLEVGQQGMMYLRKHPGNVYYGTLFNDFIAEPMDGKAKAAPGTPSSGTYAVELPKARQVASIFADPRASLQGKSPTDRYIAAASLLLRYRSSNTPMARTELVGVEETKLILSALLEVEWKTTAPSPWSSFLLLRLSEKDGWKTPTQINNLNDARTAARSWYRDHGQNYRIQRYVKE